MPSARWASRSQGTSLPLGELGEDLLHRVSRIPSIPTLCRSANHLQGVARRRNYPQMCSTPCRPLPSGRILVFMLGGRVVEKETRWILSPMPRLLRSLPHDSCMTHDTDMSTTCVGSTDPAAKQWRSFATCVPPRRAGRISARPHLVGQGLQPARVGRERERLR